MTKKISNNTTVVTDTISDNEPAGWRKTFCNPVTDTFSHAKSKGNRLEETRQQFPNGNIAFIGEKTRVSAGDSVKLNSIFNLTLNTTGYSNHSLTKVNPKAYLELLGREDTKNNIRNARREIRNTIKKYYSISVSALVKQPDGAHSRDTFHVFGKLSELVSDPNGKLYDKDGQDILFNYDHEFYNFFIASGQPRVMLIPEGLFDNLDPKKDGIAWLLGVSLASDKRNNLDNPNRTNKVDNLLKQAGILNQHGHSLTNVFKGIVIPFLRGLDKLGDGKQYNNGNGIDSLTYKMFDPDGREVKSAQDLRYLSLSDLKRYRLKVTWNNYPEKYFQNKQQTK